MTEQPLQQERDGPAAIPLPIFLLWIMVGFSGWLLLGGLVGLIVALVL